MTPTNFQIKLTTGRRKLLAKKYCTKADPESRTLQNVFRSLEKSGLIFKKSKDKHNVVYTVPLIASTKTFNEQYLGLNLDYLVST